MNNVVLVGFMGSGKTTVGRELAERLQRSFVDLDQDIEADAGRSIADLFAHEGEPGFRDREVRALERALQREGAVIAAGGGAPLRAENWARMRDGNTVVALMAEPAELARRLNGGNGRPLLGDDASRAIARLLPQRLPIYLAADLVVRTDGREATEVAGRIAGGLPVAGLRRISIHFGREPESAMALQEVTVGRNLAGVIAATLHRLRPSGEIVMVTDADIAERHAVPMRERLAAFGLSTRIHVVPAGEEAKQIGILTGIFDALGDAGLDRQGVMVVLGGGTVGDVAGFAAATWMRGIRYLQVPTTLLAMVDSSIGGKTGINLAAGKNMVGAVHQPAAIFCDLDYLSSLPDDEYRTAMAEVIKAALIADRQFAGWLSGHVRAVLQREDQAVWEAVSAAIAIKARVVGRDPSETGVRAILNYGHTVGHALERALGYGRIRHGEAVAWGMEVAARLSVITARCAEDVAVMQHRLLDSAGLLAKRPTISRAALLDALRHDKKARAGEPRWVLLTGLGQATYGNRVDSALVEQALSEVLAQ